MDHNLYEAAAKGDIEPFKNIAKDKLESIVTHNKSTVLHVHIASQEANKIPTEFVKQILETCPSLLLKVNDKGDAPLHVAAKCGNEDVVETLIDFAREKQTNKELESNVDTVRHILGMKNDEQNTALHEAVQYYSLEVVAILMKTAPDFPYSTNSSGQTPLYIAAAKGSSRMVGAILEKCPLAAHEGPNGKTALHAAVNSSASDDKVIERLLDKKKSLIREKDQHGWIPLHLAAYLGLHKITSLLLKNDESSALILDEDRKMAALHLAAGQGHFDVLEEIIRNCPECYDLVDVRGWNVLHFAMLSLNYEEFYRLLEVHPFLINLINEKDVKGNTPLHLLAALSPSSSYRVVPPNAKGNYEAVNHQNISAEQIVRYGYPKLEQEILELSKYVGSGQYLGGVTKMRRDKEIKVISFWSSLDDEIIGKEEARESHLVVAALIATVTFAAAFTVPGGYKSSDDPNQGTAILSKNAAFQAFVISDAIAMVLSFSAVFLHFILSLKAFRSYIYLFVFALALTWVAMAAMAVAFVTGTYAMVAPALGIAISSCIIGLSFFFLVFFMIYKVISELLVRLYNYVFK